MKTSGAMRTILGITMVIVVGLCAATAVGCGDKASTQDSGDTSAEPGQVSGSLRLFAYEDGFAPKYLKPFRQQNPDLDLQAAAFDSGDAAIAKMRAGFDADVLNMCVEENAERLVQLGLVQPIDTSRIKYWDNIFPAFKDLPGVTMPDGKHYMVPVDAGTTGLVYNSDKISPAPTKFADIFDPKYAGKAAMIDYPVTAIQVGALALGYEDPTNLTDEQLENIKNLYIDAKKRGQFRTFWQSWSDIANLLKTGEVEISMGYPGNSLEIQREGYPIEYKLAEEGQLLWTCGYGITKTCKNLDAAYALINYYLSPEAEAFEAKTWNYMVTNEEALKVVDPKVREEARLDMAYDLGNARPAAPPAQGYEKWVRIWQEIKAY
jgi:spermidine/putrescine transport system substrate-binding protein